MVYIAGDHNEQYRAGPKRNLRVKWPRCALVIGRRSMHALAGTGIFTGNSLRILGESGHG
jgi:hypothetical protein